VWAVVVGFFRVLRSKKRVAYPFCFLLQSIMSQTNQATRLTQSTITGLIKLIRVKQWIKNGFVLAPLIFSGLFMRVESLSQAFLAALLFSVASSATYIVNDIRDIESDRLHPKKSKSRPLAAGIVTVNQALVLLSFLYVILITAWFLVPQVMQVIIAYMLLNVLYSLYLKHQPVLDIFTIAIGFVLRVVAGAQAIDVPVSGWMAVTTLCLALYLAAIKRRQELAQSGSEARSVLQKYSVALVDRYAEMSAIGAIIFYSLFVMSARPEMVITIPLVLFGLFRYWYVVEMLDGADSPTDALIADKHLLFTVVLWIASCSWVLWSTKA
jgi:4-hydroxybenzoate polyprenyltransferase